MIKRLIYNNLILKIIEELNISISGNEVSYSDINVDFTGYTRSDLPIKYQEIKIVEAENEEEIEKQNYTVLYYGYYSNPNIGEMKNVNEERKISFTLLAPFKMTTLKYVTLIGNFKIKDAIERALEPLINDGFIIKEMNINDGEITLNHALDTVETCMNDICYKKNIYFHINELKQIYINSIPYLFLKDSMMTLNNKNCLEKELENIIPTIESTDYANVINIKNARVFHHETSNILNLEKNIGKSDIITFLNPIVIDKNIAETIVDESEDDSLKLRCPLFSIKIGGNTYEIELVDGVLEINENISIDTDSGEEKLIVLQQDSFYSNLYTGFKWNGEETTITEIESYSCLRYSNLRLKDENEIEKCKGVINASGQIERTIDYNEKWTTIGQLVEYGHSLIFQNTNEIDTLKLEFTKDPCLSIGDIVDVDMEEFYVYGRFAVTAINYVYSNENDCEWTITLKKANLISSFIDLFRPAEQETVEEVTDITIYSEHKTESISESHEIEVVADEDS